MGANNGTEIAQAYRVLIVDDGKDIVAILFTILKENGYEVFECHDGNSAVEQIKEIKPKVVLEVKEKAIKAGAFAYLSKPVDLEGLLEVINKAMK